VVGRASFRVFSAEEWIGGTVASLFWQGTICTLPRLSQEATQLERRRRMANWCSELEADGEQPWMKNYQDGLDRTL